MKLELEKLDERQKSMQRKYGNQSFFLMLLLTILNAFICERVYVWAEPLVSAMFVMYISLFYYAIRTLFADALQGKIVSKWKYALFMIPFFGLGFAIGIGFAGSGDDPALISDGKATMNAFTLFFTVLAICFAIAYIVKRSRDKRHNGDKE
jgi:hypothetical protein